MPSVIVFGALGLLGAPLVREIKRQHPSWPLTAYVRNGRSVEDVKSTLGVDRVETGDFTEFAKIKSLSKDHDIAINSGSSLTGDPITAIVAGLKERPSDAKGKLIHISGAGNFIDYGTSGSFNPSSKIWDDDNEEDIKMIHKDMFNGPSDTVALDAGKDGSVESYIVCPPIIYGGASVRSSGIGIGYFFLAEAAKALGFVPYVGDGTAVLSTVHVLDAVPFILGILDRAASGPAEGSVYSRFYQIETEKLEWKTVAVELAKVMYNESAVQSPEPRSVSFEEAGTGEAKHLMGANMQMTCNRATKMGFRATHPSILVEMHDDLKGAFGEKH